MNYGEERFVSLGNTVVVMRTIDQPKARVLLATQQLRMVLSKEKCQETPGANWTGEVCAECRFYMFWLKSGVLACEFCRIEKEWANDGRALLQRAKLAAQGIYVMPCSIIDEPEPEKYPWPLGEGNPL